MLDPLRQEESLPGWVQTLRQWDIFPKYDADIMVRSRYGVTAIALFFCGLLLISETYDFFRTQREDLVIVDNTRSATMDVYIDVLFPGLPCNGPPDLSPTRPAFLTRFLDLSLDIVDDNGEDLANVDVDLKKVRIGSDGKTVGAYNSGTGKPGERKCLRCANSDGFSYFMSLLDRTKCCTCEEVHEYYRKKGAADKSSLHPLCMADGALKAGLPGEGCEIRGFLYVPRSKGNFHVAAGHSGAQQHGGHAHHVHQILPNQVPEMADKFKVQHVVKTLRFGSTFPGMYNPLDGVSVYTPGLLRHVYLIQLVPTRFDGPLGSYYTFQYTYSNHTEKVDVKSTHWHLPGVFFKYDFSPMMAVARQASRPLSHFITRLSALLGGTFVVLGMLYKAIATLTKKVVKKRDQ